MVTNKLLSDFFQGEVAVTQPNYNTEMQDLILLVFCEF